MRRRLTATRPRASTGTRAPRTRTGRVPSTSRAARARMAPSRPRIKTVAQHSWKNPLRAYSAGVRPDRSTRRSPADVAATSWETTNRPRTTAVTDSMVTTSRAPNRPAVGRSSVSEAAEPITQTAPRASTSTRPTWPMAGPRSMSGVSIPAKTGSAVASRIVTTRSTGTQTASARAMRTSRSDRSRSRRGMSGASVRGADQAAGMAPRERRRRRPSVVSVSRPERLVAMAIAARPAMAARFVAASQSLERTARKAIGTRVDRASHQADRWRRRRLATSPTTTAASPTARARFEISPRSPMSRAMPASTATASRTTGAGSCSRGGRGVRFDDHWSGGRAPGGRGCWGGGGAHPTTVDGCAGAGPGGGGSG